MSISENYSPVQSKPTWFASYPRDYLHLLRAPETRQRQKSARILARRLPVPAPSSPRRALAVQQGTATLNLCWNYWCESKSLVLGLGGMATRCYFEICDCNYLSVWISSSTLGFGSADSPDETLSGAIGPRDCLHWQRNWFQRLTPIRTGDITGWTVDFIFLKPEILLRFICQKIDKIFKRIWRIFLWGPYS